MLKPTLRILLLSVLGSVAHAQSGEAVTILYERKVVSGPKVPIPNSAVATGLGGLIRVPVTVNADGNVVDVGEPSGPDNVCQQVTRPDVFALRDASAKAALHVKLEPVDASTDMTRSWVGFSFPERTVPVPSGADYKGPVSVASSKERITVKGDRDYSASSVPPVNGGEGMRLSGGVLNHKAEHLPRPQFPPAAQLSELPAPSRSRL